LGASKTMKKLRARDMFRINGMIFSAVTYSVNEKKVDCLLRYIQKSDGSRELRDKRYKKVSFDESFDYLSKRLPEAINPKCRKQSVEKSKIDEIYYPYKGLKSGVGSKISGKLCDMGINKDKIGITGSRLIGLQKSTSDVDMVIYGAEDFNQARSILANMKKDESSGIYALSEEDWKKIYYKRGAEISFESFVRHEKRKHNRAKLENNLFIDLLFVRGWDEIDNTVDSIDTKEKNGRIKLKTRVVDSKYCFDCPAIYEVDSDIIDRVLSYTHTYAGQAQNGETIEVVGKIEVGATVDLIIGSSRKAEGEYIVSLDLLEE